jgi:hypothetical protein
MVSLRLDQYLEDGGGIRTKKDKDERVLLILPDHNCSVNCSRMFYDFFGELPVGARIVSS